MMAFAGVPASHAAFVEVWFDLTDDSQPPLYWGVYTLVERIDRKYLANRFGPGSVDGNLYKASHAQRGPMDLIYYGARIEEYPTQNGQVAYGKMNNEDEADYSDILHLCWVVDGAGTAGAGTMGAETMSAGGSGPNEAQFMQALEAALNVDSFLRYMAVVTILDNWDTYPYTGNNYYLFNNPLSKRFEWLPWDLAWGENAQAPLFQRVGPGIVPRAPLYDKVFAIPGYQRKYAAYLDLLAHHWFTPQNVSQQAQRYAAMLAPAIHKAGGDKAFYGDSPIYPPGAFDEAWRDLARFTEQRQAFIQQELQRYLRGEP
jgi:hypothetical protein